MTTLTREQKTAVAAAKAEGLDVFAYRTHMSPDGVEFLGHSWADGGCRLGPDETPVADALGNSIAWFGVRSLDAECDLELIMDWWG